MVSGLHNLTQYHHVTNFAPDLGPVSRKSRNFLGDIILIFQNESCSVSRNLAVIFIFIFFSTYEKTSFPE